VYSAIDNLYNTYGSSSDLNSETKFAVSYTTATANRPNSYGVCFTFGRFIDSTSAGESRWYYQLAFDTSGYIYTRCAINPTSSTTTPNNWGALHILAFV
jgi:hypothetical protein